MEAFLVSTGLVALAGMGDKTQVATVMLAARFDAWAAVVAGTTLGMLLANVRWSGSASASRAACPIRLVHGASAEIFLALAVWALLAGSAAISGVTHRQRLQDDRSNSAISSSFSMA